jgi:hypothetical protein
MQNENIIDARDQNKGKTGTPWLLLSPLAFYGGLWIIFWGILFRLDFLRDDFGIILGLMNIFLYVVPTLIFTIIYERKLASTSKNFFLLSLYQSAVFGFVSVFSVVLADLERPAKLLLFFLNNPIFIITSKESPILRTAVCLAVSLILVFKQAVIAYRKVIIPFPLQAAFRVLFVGDMQPVALEFLNLLVAVKIHFLRCLFRHFPTYQKMGSPSMDFPPFPRHKTTSEIFPVHYSIPINVCQYAYSFTLM